MEPLPRNTSDTRDERLRLTALQMANSALVLSTPDLLRRAEAFLRFLKGQESPPQS